MKQVLISIRPEWLAKTFNGEKTVELRKRFPKNYRGWMNLYCTKGKPYLYKDLDSELSGDVAFISNEKCDVPKQLLNGKVVGRVWVDNVDAVVRSGMGYYVQGQDRAYTNRIANQSCLTFSDLHKYFGYKEGRAIHISKLEIFDKPKELGELKTAVHYPKNIIQIYLDYKPLTKAPQSWQYVEVEE